MTTEYRVTLRCDHPGCLASISSNAGEEAQGRVEWSASEGGWIKLPPDALGWRDICPEHAGEYGDP